MKKSLFILPLVIVVFIVFPQDALAHETHIYQIGDKEYQFVVGSLNEPVTIDDKTGVDFRATLVGNETKEEDHHSSKNAVEGLEKTLQIEIIAGDKKKVFDLQPAFGQPGAYKTTFYPTIRTTYSYRFFGTVNNVPIDLTFSCNPAGHPQAEEDKSVVKVSDQVTRKLKRGAFGCPIEKSNAGFPEPSMSLYDLSKKTQELENALSEDNDVANGSRLFGISGIIVGVLGLIIGTAAWMKRK